MESTETEQLSVKTIIEQSKVLDYLKDKTVYYSSFERLKIYMRHNLHSPKFELLEYHILDALQRIESLRYMVDTGAIRQHPTVFWTPNPMTITLFPEDNVFIYHRGAFRNCKELKSIVDYLSDDLETYALASMLLCGRFIET